MYCLKHLDEMLIMVTAKSRDRRDRSWDGLVSVEFSGVEKSESVSG